MLLSPRQLERQVVLASAKHGACVLHCPVAGLCGPTLQQMQSGTQQGCGSMTLPSVSEEAAAICALNIEVRGHFRCKTVFTGARECT